MRGENELVTTVSREQLSRKDILQLWIREWLTTVTLASWFPAFVLFFASTCSNKVKLFVLNWLENFGDYPIAKLQGVNFGSAFVSSLILFSIKYRCFHEFERVNFDAIPFNFAPFSSNIVKKMDDCHSTFVTRSLKNLSAPAWFMLLFMSLCYSTFVAGSEVQGRELVEHNKFTFYLFAMTFNPALAVFVNAMIAVTTPVLLNMGFVSAVGLYRLGKKCIERNDAVIRDEYSAVN